MNTSSSVASSRAQCCDAIAAEFLGDPLKFLRVAAADMQRHSKGRDHIDAVHAL